MKSFEGRRDASIYALVDPREPDHVRYIGLTVISILVRLKGHIDQAKRNKDEWHKSRWIRKLLADEILPEVRVVEAGTWTKEEMCQREIEHIADYRSRGHRLTNMTKGGESTLGLPSERRPTGDRSGTRRYPLSTRAHNNGRAKLSYELGAEIVAEYESGMTRKELAEKYSVSYPLICGVIRGESPWTKPPVDDYVPIDRKSRTKEEANLKRSESVKRSWEDPDVRARRSEGLRLVWQDPVYRAQKAETARRVWVNQYARARDSRPTISPPEVEHD